MADGSEAGGSSAEGAKPGLSEAVGYLRGRGGPDTVGPEAAKAEIQAQFAEVRRMVDALEAEALAVEDAMAGVSHALTRTQPPMYRRMVLRWWRMRGGQRREPVLVRIEGGPGGRVKLVQAEPSMRLRTDRGFGLCADLAKSAVRGFWALRAVRRETHGQLSGVIRALRPVARRQAVIERVRGEAAAAMYEAAGRLRDVGYDVPEDEIVNAD